MVTEANWYSWQPDDLKPYLDIIFENFATSKLMFGSDWPVCNLAASYSQVVGVLESYIAQLPVQEQHQIWHENAKTFYNL